MANFRQRREEWEATEITALDGQDLQESGQALSVASFRLAKRGAAAGSGPDEVAEMLKGEVREWMEKVPVIAAVAGTTLKERHWRAIFQAMDKHYFKDRDYTVVTLLSSNICDRCVDLFSVSKEICADARLFRR